MRPDAFEYMTDEAFVGERFEQGFRYMEPGERVAGEKDHCPHCGRVVYREGYCSLYCQAMDVEGVEYVGGLPVWGDF